MSEVFPMPDPAGEMPRLFEVRLAETGDFQLIRLSDGARVSTNGTPAALDHAANWLAAYARELETARAQVDDLFDYAANLTAYIEAGNLAGARRFISEREDSNDV